MSYLSALLNPEDRRKIWLIIEWKNSANVHSGYSLVGSEDLADNLGLEDFHTGKVVKVKTKSGVRQARIVIVSADKPFLEMEIKHLQEAVRQIGLAKKPQQQKNMKRKRTANGSENRDVEQSDQDFIDSASDWNPSTDNDSDVVNGIQKQPVLKIKNKSRKVSSRNSSSQPKKRKGSTSNKGKEKHSEKNGNLMKNNPEHHNFQTPINGTVSEMRQYQAAVERVTTPQPSAISVYNFPRQRQSIGTSNTQQYKVPPMTFDQQTQTSVPSLDPNVIFLHENQKIMGDDIAYLHKMLDEMEQKMNAMQVVIQQLQYDKENTHEVPIHTSNDPAEYILPREEPVDISILRDCNRSNINGSQENLNMSDPFSFSPSPRQNQNTSEGHNTNLVIVDMDATDMVPIGSGKTLVSRHIYNQVKWTSYTNATRKLLMSVFPRRTLATHSLTGKSSPAFTNKPAKMQLDAKKVTDIIMTVSQMCNTPENLIRNVITTKCADENKMYRIRMEKLKNRKVTTSENEENTSP